MNLWKVSSELHYIVSFLFHRSQIHHIWVLPNLLYKWPGMSLWQYTRFHREGQNAKFHCYSYLLQAVYSSNCTNFPRVINKRNVSFGWCIKLQNVNISKSSDKFPPNISPYSISYGKSDFVILIIASLKTRNTHEVTLLLSEREFPLLENSEGNFSLQVLSIFWSKMCANIITAKLMILMRKRNYWGC